MGCAALSSSLWPVKEVTGPVQNEQLWSEKEVMPGVLLLSEESWRVYVLRVEITPS